MSGAKAKGNAAFKSAKWGDAITFYSQAIEADPKDFTCIANRSAAFLQKGDFDNALVDASSCLELKANYPKAHINRGSALMALKRYDEAVQAYQMGLEQCPVEDLLRKGVEAAKMARTANSKASQLAHKTISSRRAAIVRTRKANKADNIHQYVEQTKLNVELQMASLQAQSDMVHELGTMKTGDKIDLLFYLFDQKRNGTVRGSTLATAMRNHQSDMQDEGLHSRLKKGIVMLDDDSLRLDREDFNQFCEKMVAELNTTLDEFAEFLTYQYLFADQDGLDATLQNEETTTTGTDEAATAKKADIRNGNRMRSLFVLFDKDGDSLVSFKEVAVGLYQLTHSMEETAKNAASLLLMMDKDDKRLLEYEQFSKLILAVGAASNRTFDELYDELILAVTSDAPLSQEIIEQITIADEAYEAALQQERQIIEEKTNKKVINALTNSRAQSLFKLWDANGDGTIDFQELLTGLRRYQTAKHGSKNIAEIEKTALMMIGHDEDSNQTLDEEEFAAAMVNYAEAVGEDLHDLIDFMCVISAKPEEDTAYEKAFLTSRSKVERKSSRMVFNMSLGTIVDIEMGEEEEEEEEEDDW